MKAGWTISAIGHAAVLAWGLVSIAAKPLNSTPPESLPIDIISATDFSQLTQGIRTAPKAEAPKPLVEKVAEAKPVEEQNAKVVENKPEITATAERVEPPKPPEPEKKKVEPKPAQPAAKSEPKQAFAKEPEPKIDPIAEALFATAIGLVAAIPATIFYNKFVSEVNKQAQRLEGFADEFAAILSRQIDEAA